MPSVLVRTLYAEEASGAPATARAGGAPRTLVVVQLGGGNDGLSTVVPYQDGRYYDLRPALALEVERDGLLPLWDGQALHASLAPLLPLWDRGDLAIVQGVGYPAPNRSHFRSMDIWHTAAPATIIADGWLGRYLDFNASAAGNRWQAVSVGAAAQPLALAGRRFVPAMRNAQSYHLLPTRHRPSQPDARLIAWHALHEAAGARAGSQPLLSRTGLEAFASIETLQGAAADYTPRADYPAGNTLAAALETVAQVIDAGLGAAIGYVTINGFDTHAGQRDRHDDLLGEVATALRAFLDDVTAHGYGDDVMVLAFSEFGRRVPANGSAGSDHGMAGPVFLAGARVAGGLYGEPPDLGRLDRGDLQYTVDFRRVYATVLEQWLETPAAPILLGAFDALPLLAL